MINCKYFNQCGGCNYLDVDYPKQLNMKQNYVQDCINNEKINFKVLPTTKNNNQFKYRNKLHLAFKELRGKTLIGFFEENCNLVVDVNSCLLFDNWADNIISILRKFLKDFKIRPFNKITKQGVIKYAVARKLNDQLLLTLVVTSDNFAGKKILYELLVKYFKNVSLYININKRNDNAVFDECGFKHLFGTKSITGEMQEIKYSLSPTSFFQVNEYMANIMYNKALELMELKESENVLDLFSGIGITSILFAKHCQKVTSIEYSKTSFLDSLYISKLNHVDKKVHFLNGDCEKLLQLNDFHDIDKIFLDPTRLGCSANLVDLLIKIKAKKIVYMSCNKETLAINLKQFIDSKKYILTYLAPFDMFPNTKHIELLSVLELINA